MPSSQNRKNHSISIEREREPGLGKQKPALITVACYQATFLAGCLGSKEHDEREEGELESMDKVHVCGSKERPEYRYAV